MLAGPKEGGAKAAGPCVLGAIRLRPPEGAPGPHLPPPLGKSPEQQPGSPPHPRSHSCRKSSPKKEGSSALNDLYSKATASISPKPELLPWHPTPKLTL